MTIFLALIVLFVLLLLYGYIQGKFFKKYEYNICFSDIDIDKKIVFLSDLHCNSFGKNNKKLIKCIEGISPDFICISGDLSLKNGKKTDVAISLLGTLSKKYTIFYSPGNHEIKMPNYSEYKQSIRALGINYLENEAFVYENIKIYGLDILLEHYHKFWIKSDFNDKSMENYLGKKDDMFSILLAHNPEYFEYYAKYGADLTLSGHVHGGILRLPILKGFISPSLRLFPKYSAGHYSIDNKHMILSRGLGLHHIKFRFFNVPEVSVIRILKGDKA